MKSEKTTPRLIIDIDITTEYPNHVVRNTIVTCPLVKWCTVKYDISTSNGYRIILNIKYKGIKKPYEIVIDQIDKDTMYKLYDTLLNCIKYKTVEYANQNDSQHELLPHTVGNVDWESKCRYVQLEVTPTDIVLRLTDYDDTAASYCFGRLK